MGNSFRILYITREEHPSHRPDIDALFGKYLPRLGVNTTLVAKCKNRCRSWTGGELHCLPFGGLRKFQEIIMASLECDAIQVRDKIFTGLALSLWATLTNRRFFYWMSWPFAEDDIEKYRYMGVSVSWGKRVLFRLRGHLQRVILYRFVIPLSNHVFVQSEAMKLWLSEHGRVPLQQMTEVPMGIDLEEVERLMECDLTGYKPGETLTVAYLGVINRLRMESVFFDAIKEFLEQVPSTMMQFIGGGQEVGDEEWLVGEMSRRGLQGRFSITGWVSREEGWRLLAKATVAINILPRHVLLDTSSPTKVIEYAAIGVPCVATDIPDQAYVIEKLKCGICVPYQAKAIATAIISLLRDEGSRNHFAKNGGERVREFRSYQTISERLARVYYSLLQ